MSKSPNRDKHSAEAPLRLDAITLRGIGSYLRGARLEVRPITILCGKNGSGKSTWIKALNTLSESLPTLPFFLSGSRTPEGEEDCEDIRFANAFFALLGNDEVYRRLSFDPTESQYGPPFTIGLEFSSTENFSPSDDLTSILTHLAPSHRLETGTRFRIRIAHPISTYSDDSITALTHFVELQIGDSVVVRFIKDREVERQVNGERKPAMPTPYHCEVSVNPGTKDASSARSNKKQHVADFFVDKIVEADRQQTQLKLRGVLGRNGTTDTEAKKLVEHVVACIRTLLDSLLGGICSIGAIRNTFSERELPELSEEELLAEGVSSTEDALTRRRVGRNGGLAWHLERDFAYCVMRQAGTVASTLSDSYHFEGYVSHWMKKFVGVEVTLRDNSTLKPIDESLSESALPPIGFLELPDSGNHARVSRDSEAPDDDPTNMRRLMNGCFGPRLVQQPPANMSSGFHQIFPIVVQTGLIRKNELFAIENPEVHLHPGLQLDLMEYFLLHATTGRQFLIETHSDLLLRRTLREILEESIGLGQGNIRIYFTGTREPTSTDRDDPDSFATSTLTAIEIDDSGRIANWPDGFLGDDLRESRRLFNVMYGVIDDEPEA